MPAWAASISAPAWLNSALPTGLMGKPVATEPQGDWGAWSRTQGSRQASPATMKALAPAPSLLDSPEPLGTPEALGQEIRAEQLDP